jgi:hypothetical protein
MQMLRVLALLAALTASAQWNQFRGPNGSGVAQGTGYPVEFSPAKNVAWKTAVPYGQSSPVVAGGKVYLTASDDEKLITVAMDHRSVQSKRSRVADARGGRQGCGGLFRGFWTGRLYGGRQRRLDLSPRAIQEFLWHVGLADSRRQLRHPTLRSKRRIVSHCYRPLDRKAAVEDGPSRR